MASIVNAQLSIRHDHNKRTAHAVVKCTVRFTGLEQCLMECCSKNRMFKLKCQLWGADSGLTGADDYLYTYGTVHYFPDGSPTSSEDRTFDVTVGEGLLNEDWGTDEVYGRLLLDNLFTQVSVKRNTNVVSHNF